MSDRSARTPLIAGNWKMNLDHLQAIAFVQKLQWKLSDANHDFAATEVAVFPPFTDLRSVQTIAAADRYELRYGGQDLSPHDSGAYTGDISGAFLAALDCAYVIIGHSERRQYHGETDEQVAEKVAAAHRNGLVPIVCVGETEDDLENRGLAEVPAEQLRVALASAMTGREVVVAYEPVWAIGTGKAATPAQAQQVCAILRGVVAEVLGAEAAAGTRILYGGSVKSGNVAAFLRESDIDGALVGGASLQVDEFAAIARYRSHVGV